ncbi:DsbA family oxidoreductase [Burkholderia cenocepacia]|uniref:DsbA family oxidoreductase n=1 Tax=Burkholderia cenocepacia TaxID=95486 RepID=UPI002AB6F926|nr:DsbA family oxidoreductase [Burkholderia cenocepacia]
MKIELWCDIVCPFCGLAVHRLETALAAFEHRDAVQVVHRSFQVHPELDRSGVSQHDLIVMHGRDVTDTENRILRPIEQAAEREGLVPYRAIDRTLGPTDYAHELLAYATDKGLHAEAWKRMFRAHFGEARKLWTLDEVVSFGVELGLDADETSAVLNNRKYRAQVENDQHEAQRLGATGTPFMVIDRKHAIPGSLGTDQLLGTLRRIWQEQ